MTARPQWLLVVLAWLLVLGFGAGLLASIPATVGAAYYPMGDGMHLPVPRMNALTLSVGVALVVAILATVLARKLAARTLAAIVAATFVLPLAGLAALPWIVGPQPDHVVLSDAGTTFAVPRHFAPRGAFPINLTLTTCGDPLLAPADPACPPDRELNQISLMQDWSVYDAVTFGSDTLADVGLTIVDGVAVLSPERTGLTVLQDGEGTQISFAKATWTHRLFVTSDGQVEMWTACRDQGAACLVAAQTTLGVLQFLAGPDIAMDGAAIAESTQYILALLVSWRCPDAPGCATAV